MSEFIRRGLAHAEREVQRLYVQWQVQGCPRGGCAEAILVKAGQRLGVWQRLRRPAARHPEGIAA